MAIEQELLVTVQDMCRKLGLYCYHTHDSRGSEPGFPDLVITGHMVLFRELKADPAIKLTREQTRWGRALIRAGANWRVWTLEDLWSGRIRAELEAVQLIQLAPVLHVPPAYRGNP